MSGPIQNRRVLSGMRPTGMLHLGNYHGALKNWIELQYQYECFFFIADWHALTTGYEDTSKLEEHVWTMAISLQISLIAYAVGSFFAPVAYLWYLYNVAGFAVCLKLLVMASRRNRRSEASARRSTSPRSSSESARALMLDGS